jgi:cell division protein FtsB
MKRKHMEETSRRRGKILLILVAVISAFLMVNSLIGETGWLARRAQQKKIEALNSEVEKIRNENLRLSTRINDLKHDPATIEAVAREQLRLGRSEDVVVALPKPATAE